MEAIGEIIVYIVVIVYYALLIKYDRNAMKKEGL